jgi:hypothetical protein
MDPAGLHGQKMRQPPSAPRRYDGENGNPIYDTKNGGHFGTSTLRHWRVHTVLCALLSMSYKDAGGLTAMRQVLLQQYVLASPSAAT